MSTHVDIRSFINLYRDSADLCHRPSRHYLHILLPESLLDLLAIFLIHENLVGGSTCEMIERIVRQLGNFAEVDIWQITHLELHHTLSRLGTMLCTILGRIKGLSQAGKYPLSCVEKHQIHARRTVSRRAIVRSTMLLLYLVRYIHVHSSRDEITQNTGANEQIRLTARQGAKTYDHNIFPST